MLLIKYNTFTLYIKLYYEEVLLYFLKINDYYNFIQFNSDFFWLENHFKDKIIINNNIVVQISTVTSPRSS